MRAIERRQNILDTLCRRRRDTMSNLAFEFGVTTRTIWNDIAELSLTYPIYTAEGHDGGVYIEEGYYPDKHLLNTKEQMLLMALMERCVDEDERKTLQGIIDGFGRKNLKQGG